MTPPKVIIVAAGPTQTGKYRFPPNSKPKNLFHYNGETLLDHQLGAFKECGVKSFRLVTGYRSEDLVAYNKKNKLGLEIIHDPDWNTEAFHTIRVALNGVDEDVILVFADTMFLSQITLKQFLASEDPLVCLCHGDPKKGVGSPDAIKVDREALPLMRRLEEYDYAPEQKIYEGIRMVLTIQNLIRDLGVLVYGTGMIDVDFFGQTDEGGRLRRRAKKR